MKAIVNVLLAAGLCLTANAALAAEAVQVKQAWIREAPANARALGAFATVANGTGQARTLVAAHSSAAERVELHKSVNENGVHKMVAVDGIEVPAKGEARLEPGGFHIMLINPKQALKAGDKVEITLEFKNGPRIPVAFEVRRADGMAMDHGAMGGHNMGGMDHGAMHH